MPAIITRLMINWAKFSIGLFIPTLGIDGMKWIGLVLPKKTRLEEIHPIKAMINWKEENLYQMTNF